MISFFVVKPVQLMVVY